MRVTHKIKMALDQRMAVPPIDAVQGDSNTRAVEMALFSGRAPWEIPEGVNVLVRFRKPDGTGGVYDTLPDGRSASEYSNNLVTIILVPQMLTVPGKVQAQVELNAEEKTLGTFTFCIQVEPDPSVGAMDSKDYFNLSAYVEAEVERILGGGTGGTGGVDFRTDETLKLENGILSVNTTNDIEKDNTLPITSAGVYATVGNIEALLKTI